MNKKNNIIAICFVFMIMILNAICDNVRGVFIPVFKQEFKVNDTNIAIMIMACSIGFIIFTYIGGLLCEKIGQKMVFILGFIFTTGSLVLLSFTPNFSILLIGMFGTNIGLALTSISINTLIPVLFISFQAILMNITHFCYGVGSTLAQRTSGLLLYNGVGWRVIYRMVSVFALVLLIGFLFIEIPKVYKPEENKDTKDNIDIKSNIKLIVFFAAALGFYVFAEQGTGNWFVNFLDKHYRYNKNMSSFYIALFFGLFSIGRLLGGFIVEKTGYLKTVLISLIIAFILYLAGLVMGEKGIAVVSASGLFFAVIFPTVVLVISKVFKKGSAYITGIIITFATVIAMFMNLLIGYLNDKIGIYQAFYLIPISLFISIVFIGFIYINTKEHFVEIGEKDNV